jgi:predicted transcriptional regulator
VLRQRSALPRLGELEFEVLEFLWRSGEADVIEVHVAVGKRRKITPNTIGSTLERLHRKGLTQRQKVSHAFRYRAALPREEFAARRVLTAAGGLKNLASAGLLSAFVDLVADSDDAALDRLESLIAQKRSERGGA